MSVAALMALGAATDQATVTGGNGGSGLGVPAGGNGAIESLTNAVSGLTSGYLTLIQYVYDGSGGVGGGMAGSVTSNLTLTQNGVSSLMGSTFASGGNGGFSTGIATTGSNENATTNLTSNTAGAITADAAAAPETVFIAGGGSINYPGTEGAGGNATATSTATGTIA